MTIYHDAYLLSLNQFAENLKPLLHVLQDGQSNYSQLTDAAFTAFDHNPFVRWLADNYGSWDRKGYEEALLTPQWRPPDIAFWLLPLLYDHLRQPDEERMGLGTLFHPLKQFLLSGGWSDEDATTLIYGHPFAAFAHQWLGSSAARWEHLHPVSTGGRAGWISLGEIPLLLDKLDQAKTQKNSEAESAIRAMTRILLAAQASNADLCLIVSG